MATVQFTNRPALREILIAAAAPTLAYGCFPSWWFPRFTPLASLLSGLLPRRAWEIGTTGCMGQPVGEPELVRAELIFKLAEGLTVFSIALAVVALVQLVAVMLRRRRGRSIFTFPIWSLLLSLASVTAQVWGTLASLQAM